MTQYRDLLGRPELAGLELMAPEAIDVIRSSYPTVPYDYTSFLIEIGWGDVNGKLMIYSGLVGSEDVFGVRLQSQQIVLLGDDYQGFSFGFDLRDWSIVEVDSSNHSSHVIHGCFEEFIRDQLSL